MGESVRAHHRLVARVAVLAALWLLSCGEADEPSAGVPRSAEVDAAGPEQALVERELLAQLGYVEWSSAEDSAARGVTIQDDRRAAGGLNLFKSGPRFEAQLMAADGRIVHRWRAPEGGERSWHHVELLPDGSLLAIEKTAYVEKLDWAGRRLWKTELNGHHDLDVAADGRVLVLIEGIRRVLLDGELLPIIDHGIAVLDAQGVLQREIWLSPLLVDRIPSERVEAIARHIAEHPDRIHRKVELLDVFHVNSLELLRSDLGGIARRGDVLISVRELDLIGIVDLDGPRLLWSWGPGILDRQHQPSVLGNGHVLVFDNGTRRGWSRVLEIDPVSGEVAWQYEADPRESFFTDTRGGAERLPGGNTLITESKAGRAFEVTPSGRLVWSYLNPDVEDGQRATIYRMARLSTLALDPALVADR